MNPLIARCFIDLTTRILPDGVPYAFGRDVETDELLRILAAPITRHPVIIGQTGVGKSALLHEVARRLLRGECPPSLANLRLLATTPRQLLAGLPPGDGWRTALPELWEEVVSAGPLLLFLHEAHDAVGLGNRFSHEPDIAAVLTDILPRNYGDVTLRLVAEAREDRWGHLSSGRLSFTTLFLPFRMPEPQGELLDAILATAGQQLESKHNVLLTESARIRAIDLTRRYVVKQAQPGKSLALLEETMAAIPRPEGEVPEVNASAVTARFAQRTGLPMVLLDEEALWQEEAVREFFQRRVLGQELAVESVIQRLSLLKAGIQDSRRPLGVFLFIGPTGVGKTELTKALTSYLFGREDWLVRINMADYSEHWQFSQLFGVPDPDEPLEVQRGLLTTRLGEQTFTILLLDEFEKAHPNIFQRFLQLFDEGVLINGAGENINLRNSFIILTSNLAADMRQQSIGFLRGDQAETIEQRVMRTAEEYFTPEFVNRIDQIVFFQPLSRATTRQITIRELESLMQREGLKRREIRIEWDDSLIDWVVSRGYSERFGARYLRRQIEKLISYPVARALVSQPVQSGSLLRIYVRGGENGVVKATLMPPAEATSLGETMIELDGVRRRLTIEELREEIPPLRERVEKAVTLHQLPELRTRRDELLAQMGQPDFWDNGNANQRLLAELGTLSARVELMDSLTRAANEANDLLEKMWGKNDFASLGALGRLHFQLRRDLARAELDLSFTDAFDPLDGWITLSSSGEEVAEEAKWLGELVGMYLGWAKERRFEALVVDELRDDNRLRHVRIRVNGHGAFALLRGENGLHRLVESAETGGMTTRQVRVTVHPQIEGDQFPIPYNELILDGAPVTVKGQFLKKLRSRVTVIHRPTRETIEVCSEGALQESEILAINLLRAALTAKENSLIPAPDESPWGDVVRNYQRHREHGVRDVRTGLAARNIRHVLSGKIDPFLMAALVRRSKT
jgi:ATP-dependent Clp protease ATP-binding subunit ClpC